MSEVVYRIVEHDGGWAYQFDGVYSETFSTRAQAETAATQAAAEQRVPGEEEAIEWQDDRGRWHQEFERGDDRPVTSVETVPSWSRAEQRQPAERPLAALLLAAGIAGVVLALLVRKRDRA